MAKVKLDKKEKKVKEPKPKKEKKAKVKKGAEEGAPDFTAAPAAPKRKAPADLYTLVLLIAWIALTAACVLAYLDLNSYK